MAPRVPETMQQLIDRGVDGLIPDRPDLAQSVLLP